MLSDSGWSSGAGFGTRDALGSSTRSSDQTGARDVGGAGLWESSNSFSSYGGGGGSMSTRGVELKSEADWDRNMESADKKLNDLTILQWGIIKDQMTSLGREVVALHHEVDKQKSEKMRMKQEFESELSELRDRLSQNLEIQIKNMTMSLETERRERTSNESRLSQSLDSLMRDHSSLAEKQEKTCADHRELIVNERRTREAQTNEIRNHLDDSQSRMAKNVEDELGRIAMDANNRHMEVKDFVENAQKTQEDHLGKLGNRMQEHLAELRSLSESRHGSLSDRLESLDRRSLQSINQVMEEHKNTFTEMRNTVLSHKTSHESAHTNLAEGLRRLESSHDARYQSMGTRFDHMERQVKETFNQMADEHKAKMQSEKQDRDTKHSTLLERLQVQDEDTQEIKKRIMSDERELSEVKTLVDKEFEKTTSDARGMHEQIELIWKHVMGDAEQIEKARQKVSEIERQIHGDEQQLEQAKGERNSIREQVKELWQAVIGNKTAIQDALERERAGLAKDVHEVRENVKAFELRIQADEESIDVAKGERMGMAKQLLELWHHVTGDEEAIREAKAERSSMSDKIQTLERQVQNDEMVSKEIKTQAQGTANQVKELWEHVLLDEKAIAEGRNERSTIAKKVAELEKAQDDAGGERRGMSKQLTELWTQVMGDEERTRESLGHMKNEHASVADKVSELCEYVLREEKQIEQAKNERKNMMQQISEIWSHVTGDEEALAEAKGVGVSLAKQISEVQQSLIEAKSVGLGKQVSEQRLQAIAMAKKIADLEAKLGNGSDAGGGVSREELRSEVRSLWEAFSEHTHDISAGADKNDQASAEASKQLPVLHALAPGWHPPASRISTTITHHAPPPVVPPSLLGVPTTPRTTTFSPMPRGRSLLGGASLSGTATSISSSIAPPPPHTTLYSTGGSAVTPAAEGHGSLVRTVSTERVGALMRTVSHDMAFPRSLSITRAPATVTATKTDQSVTSTPRGEYVPRSGQGTPLPMYKPI
eukprot:gnl/TRDRNA2_/TRDRNA2_86058_c0_seq1.p1 gnl/TRDRNA2_/TRDRNA2_86058_c0~~gnl/TRDRNA2_/TRDRNA2_86058_c0_seq1.p1  ORF type:complete len:999 (-),score=249.89 gnl/TRDRNA2_/TRDRNA2_86058_c0_seq1:139-3135(-)